MIATHTYAIGKLIVVFFFALIHNGKTFCQLTLPVNAYSTHIITFSCFFFCYSNLLQLLLNYITIAENGAKLRMLIRLITYVKLCVINV